MKNVLIVYNPSKRGVESYLKTAEKLLKKSYEVRSCASDRVDKSFYNTDVIVTLGGDGTILRVGHFAIEREVPVMGINLGGMGYLAEFRIKEVLPVIRAYFDGKKVVSQRSVLEVWLRGKKHFAINDCVIKSHSSKVIKVDVSVNERMLSSIIGDGVIVATPTGSTAYSLATGGSIVEPEARVILLTPVCPHSLTHRPVILDESKNIRLKIAPYKMEKKVVLSLDSQKMFLLEPQEVVSVKVSEKKLLFISNPKKSFYRILKEKLRWGER